MKLSKSDLIYMAGFVDADGSIGICSNNAGTSCVLRLSVTNRNYNVVKMFATAFGTGNMRKRNPNHKKWQPVYEWTIAANKALKAVVLLQPYLRIKKKQAALGIELQRLKSLHTSSEKSRNPKLMSQLTKKYMILKSKCHKLNKRGLLPNVPTGQKN